MWLKEVKLLYDWRSIMEYDQFLRLSTDANVLVKDGRLKEAEATLLQLVMSDISELDRAEICAMMASVYDRLGKSEEALGWFDKGIACEQSFCRFEIEEKKAEYLSELGQHTEAIGIYERLLIQPYLTESDKERMRGIIRIELGKSLSEWR
jgi:tetratricopeptide (TPR) repeat protein